MWVRNDIVRANMCVRSASRASENPVRAQKLVRSASGASEQECVQCLWGLRKPSSSEKARSKRLWGLRKILSQRERGHFERARASASGQGAREARSPRGQLRYFRDGFFVLVPTGEANDEMCAPMAPKISEMCSLKLEHNNRLRR